MPWEMNDFAKQVMILANKEAKQWGHQYIGTEHILLALLKVENGLAYDVLRQVGINLDRVLEQMMSLVQRGTATDTPPRLPETPRAKKVHEYSMEEARNLNQGFIGTEHLLLGLLRETESVAGQILSKLGLSLEKARQEIARLSGSNVAVVVEKTAPSPPAQLMRKREESAIHLGHGTFLLQIDPSNPTVATDKALLDTIKFLMGGRPIGYIIVGPRK